jgi:protein-tyrosine phosphatase
MTVNVLFVYLGHICRSPSAHAVLSALAAQRGQTVAVDSSGTGELGSTERGN